MRLASAMAATGSPGKSKTSLPATGASRMAAGRHEVRETLHAHGVREDQSFKPEVAPQRLSTIKGERVEG